jgi:solute carrier family 25 (mitochondrial oxoglutarate transporter), member 11
MSDNKAWNTVKPFLNGGLSGMGATCLIQPIDMVKVRIQLGAKGSPFTVAKDIIAKDGFGAMYKGLSAGLLRQATYTTTRMGLFDNMTAAYKEFKGGKNTNFGEKAMLGASAGGLAAVVGNPADLTLIRMQADGTLPPEQRRNYKGVGDAFARIVREEGVGGLFKGCAPTVVRAMALNTGMFATNEQAKELLKEAGVSGFANTAGGAMVAGFFASAASLPFDFVKTRIQKMKPNADGTVPYTGPIDCALKTLRNEGPLAFYTGFPTYYVRIGPHVVFTLVFASMLPKLQKEMGL